MKNNFRQSMAWLHTWVGLVPGWVLYFVFVTGTIGYFYVEIDHWTRPERPIVGKNSSLTLPELLGKAEIHLNRFSTDTESWGIRFPVGRYSGGPLRVRWTSVPNEQNQQERFTWFYDPVKDTFEDSINERETGGGDALYHMHEYLHYMSQDTGELIVFVCSLAMFVTIISGIITHKKIFRDFFTFRQGINQRAWLDMHNVSSVLALPFILMITYSGLVFYMDSYVTAPVETLYGTDQDIFGTDGNSSFQFGQPASVDETSIFPLIDFLEQETNGYWRDETDAQYIQYFRFHKNQNDINFEANLRRGDDTSLLRGYQELYFSAEGENFTRNVKVMSGGRQAESVLYGLHEGSFAGPVLRWLYFGSGLLGCIMIGSGLVLWTVKRKRKQEANGKPSFGFHLVETLNIGTIAGLLVGVAAYFWANRLLPVGMDNRADWEMHCLFIAWGAMFVHAALRQPGRAWVESFAFGAALFAFLPLLNALTTDRHLGVTLPAGDWTLAGFDLTVLAFGALLGVIAWKVNKRISVGEVSGSENFTAGATVRG